MPVKRNHTGFYCIDPFSFRNVHVIELYICQSAKHSALPTAFQITLGLHHFTARMFQHRMRNSLVAERSVRVASLNESNSQFRCCRVVRDSVKHKAMISIFTSVCMGSPSVWVKSVRI